MIVDFSIFSLYILNLLTLQLLQAKKMLKNMRVKATHSNREFKIIGLSELPCNKQL